MLDNDGQIFVMLFVVVGPGYILKTWGKDAKDEGKDECLHFKGHCEFCGKGKEIQATGGNSKKKGQ
jgi:hypothetical protein